MPLLLGIIGTSLTDFVVRILTTLGVGFVTYSVVLPNLIDYVSSRVLSLPDYALQLLGILRFDICVTIIFSAYVAKGSSDLFLKKK